VVPGTQIPVQAPLTHADALHARAGSQVPVALHVCTPLLEHCLAPGTHTPAHAPLTHALLVHAVPSCQEPVLSQVCTV
jgi:hypothetical protein